jgi:hypothetical protein
MEITSALLLFLAFVAILFVLSIVFDSFFTVETGR